MGQIVFQEFPKIPRLRRDMVITEKIDGTNAAVGIVAVEDVDHISPFAIPCTTPDGREYYVYAQSRKRLISPVADNYGFAQWVQDYAPMLAADLGPGLHFGEWWGYGINRGYGLDNRRFSLFNVKRWEDTYNATGFYTPGLTVVPVLWRGQWDDREICVSLMDLMDNGSHAAPGFLRPEGIVVFHKASGSLFKVTIEGDDQPKALSSTLASLGAL